MGIGSTFERDAAENGRPRLVRLHHRGGAIRRHARNLRLERDLGGEPDVTPFVFQERPVLSGTTFPPCSMSSHGDLGIRKGTNRGVWAA